MPELPVEEEVPKRKQKEKKQKKESSSEEDKKQKKKKDEQALEKLQQQVNAADVAPGDLPDDGVGTADDDDDWVFTDIDLTESKLVVHVLAGELELWRVPTAAGMSHAHPGAVPLPAAASPFSRICFQKLSVAYVPPAACLCAHRDSLYQESDIRVGIEWLDIVEVNPILEKVYIMLIIIIISMLTSSPW